MHFQRLAHIDIRDGETGRRVAVYHGDLSAIPQNHAVDILVVSAFPNDYTPTANSLIGALHRAGLSVAQLATDKEHDLREVCSVWLSKPLRGLSERLPIKRIACFEGNSWTPPPQLVGSLFRGLFPFLAAQHNAVVAMPLLASGDQQYPASLMFDEIVNAASHWMSRGLEGAELKIVIRDYDTASELASRLLKAQAPEIVRRRASNSHFDVFLSFCSVDSDAAQIAKSALLRRPDVSRIFDYRLTIDAGASWQRKIDEAITTCRSVVALISPSYIASAECQEEIFQARLRNKREGGSILFPIYWRQWEGELDLWLQLLQASDCREADEERLSRVISSFTFS